MWIWKHLQISWDAAEKTGLEYMEPYTGYLFPMSFMFILK